MRKAIKIKGKCISAWKLGENSAMENKLIREGTLKQTSNGIYEVFSREAISGIGEKASVGDYIKVDSNDFPYPNAREYFEKNHRHIEGDTYEQVPSPVDVWFVEDEMCEEIQFLIDNKELKFNTADNRAYFNAPLWGTVLSAAKDAAIVLYSVTRACGGKIIDIDFNFVAKDEFEKSYRFLSEK